MFTARAERRIVELLATTSELSTTDVGREAKVGALFLTLALFRLEQRGTLASRFEERARRPGGPRRRLYRLSADGRREVAIANRAMGDLVATHA